jgi:hypothetical protein
MQIARALKSPLANLLLSKKNFVTTKTEKKDVLCMIQKLTPYSTSTPLIRLGPDGDGGFLVPDDLDGIEACFSPGVSTVSGFEKNCADLGMNVFLADKSVDNPAENNEKFNFIKKFIGAKNNTDFITIDDWVKATGVSNDSDLLLQMDIEGFEYEVILNCSGELLNRFRVIVIEFHDLSELWNRPFFNLASHAIDKILQTHTCVHIHPNNYSKVFKKDGLEIPPLAEFTFLRKDRVGNPVRSKSYPHSLDRDNTDNPSLVLPKCWYSY